METLEYENLILELSEDGTQYKVVGCQEDAERVVIPFKVNGIPVMGIGDEAFLNKTKLKEVEFPSDEEFAGRIFDDFPIGTYAFRGCSSLKTIYIPGGITEIGWGAFQYCMQLEEVEMHRCYVAPYAFYHCESLKKISPIMRLVSEGTFSHCKALEVFPVADDVETLEEDCFEHCYALTEIVIPKSVTRIEPLAFRNCRGLKKVVFEEPNGWRGGNRYSRASGSLELSNPENNARWLATMDFDDGETGWYRK